MSRREDSRRARPLSYANVIATLALVVAVGGGTAWAAHHYLITSTKQIKPSLLRSLHGKAGATGGTGATGAAGGSGATGGTGATGSPGTNLTAETVLPSGQSESGTYGGNTSASGSVFAITVQYTQPLASPIDPANIIETSSTTSFCPGQGQAARGYLCLYDLENHFSIFQGAIVNYDLLPSPDPGALLFYTASAANASVFGTWTVTAP